MPIPFRGGRGILLALLMAGWVPRAAASALIENLKNGEPQVVVAYGTSLTANATTGSVASIRAGQWVNDLRNWLEAVYPGLATVINSGQSGKASNTGVQLLSSAVLSKNPAVVIIEFSMNDAFTQFGVNGNTNTMDAYPPITLARAKSNLESMITSIRAQNPFAEIILMTMNVAYDTAANPISRRPDLASYHQVYRDVAAEQDLLLVDNYATWKEIHDTDFNLYKTYVPDGVHPSATAATLVTFANLKSALIAVPEPSSIALSAVASLLLIGVHSWARRTDPS